MGDEASANGLEDGHALGDDGIGSNRCGEQLCTSDFLDEGIDIITLETVSLVVLSRSKIAEGTLQTIEGRGYLGRGFGGKRSSAAADGNGLVDGCVGDEGPGGIGCAGERQDEGGEELEIHGRLLNGDQYVI